MGFERGDSVRAKVIKKLTTGVILKVSESIDSYFPSLFNIGAELLVTVQRIRDDGKMLLTLDTVIDYAYSEVTSGEIVVAA